MNAPATITKPTLAQRMIPLATVALVFPVLVPCWVVVLPRLFFDVDPRSEGADIVTTLGPAGFGMLACLGVLGALLAMATHVANGGVVRWKSTALIFLGVAFTAWHMPTRFENLWHGTGWIWGATAGLAALHLGTWTQARRWSAALLAGLAGALVVEAVFYVFVEHAEIVREFERNADQFLGMRGWEAGSSEATLYERRLRTDDAIGALGLSNVLATVAAALAVLGGGVVLGRVAMKPVTEQRNRTGAIAWGLAVCVCGALVVKLTNSAGGLGAVVLTGGWLVAVVLVIRKMKLGVAFSPAKPGDGQSRVLGGWRLCVGCSALALPASIMALVLFRGWLGVPSPEEVGHGIKGELSVLFRAQYWGAAWRMVTDSASNLMLGVGPGGFGDLYLIHKNPLNPEEVTSAHNVFVDWITMLGLGGWAWSAVVLAWLWTGARGFVSGTGCAGRVVREATGNNDDGRSAGYGVLALALLLFGGEAFIAWPELAQAGLGALGPRLLAGGLFVALSLGGLSWARGDGQSNEKDESSARSVKSACGWALRLGLVGAAVVVVTHAQFDMGFFQPTSAPVLWVIVGLGGAQTKVARVMGTHKVLMRRAGWILVVSGLFSIVFTMWAGASLWRYGHETSQAAVALRRGDVEQARSELYVGNKAVGFDAVALRSRVGLVLPPNESSESVAGGESVASRWREAVCSLLLARLELPADVSLGSAVLADPDNNRAELWSLLEEELLRRDTVTARHAGTTRLMARAAEALLEAEADGLDAEHLSRRRSVLLTLVGGVIAYSPHSVRDRVWLADLFAQFGDATRASETAKHALKLNAQRYLDPGKQLDEVTRARMELLAGGVEGQ